MKRNNFKQKGSRVARTARIQQRGLQEVLQRKLFSYLFTASVFVTLSNAPYAANAGTVSLYAARPKTIVRNTATNWSAQQVTHTTPDHRSSTDYVVPRLPLSSVHARTAFQRKVLIQRSQQDLGRAWCADLKQVGLVEMDRTRPRTRTRYKWAPLLLAFCRPTTTTHRGRSKVYSESACVTGDGCCGHP